MPSLGAATGARHWWPVPRRPARLPVPHPRDSHPAHALSPVLLADAIVALHLAIVLFVIFGQLFVVVGGLFRWSCVRSLAFRLSHALILLVVIAQALLDRLCFLTVWEARLREAAGAEAAEGSFVGRLARDVLFVDGVTQEELYPLYYAFAGVVLLSWILLPPQRKSKRAARAQADSDAARG